LIVLIVYTVETHKLRLGACPSNARRF
jgi:hypothetical protein